VAEWIDSRGVATGWLALLGGSTHAQDVVGNAVTPVNEALPSNLRPSIASSIPVLAQLKKGLPGQGFPDWLKSRTPRG
jgi:hypothetical protein